MAANGKQKNRKSLKVAKGAYPLPIGDVYGITDKGFYLDRNGDPYKNQGGRLIPDGDYNPRKHGALIPDGLVQKNKKRDGLKIARLPRLSGSGVLTGKEFERALKIINSTSPNEQIRQKREDILIHQARFGV